MSSALITDLRHRPTHRRVWALAGPMLLSNLTVPLVALVDTAVVGHLPHDYQLAAVAVGGSLYTLLVWAMGFLRMGTTGFAAQACGRQDGSALRTLLAQGLALGAGLGLLLALALLPLMPWLLSVMNPSAALDTLAREYLSLRLLGLPAALCSFALIGWLLGTQNARIPLLMLLTSALLNTGLDILFVWGLGFGVAGAAWASVIAEWSGMLLGLCLALPTLRPYTGQLDHRRLLRWSSWTALLAVNRDIFIRTLALEVVFLLLTVYGTRLGDATVAANALLLNGLLLTANALDGLAHAVEALCGKAIGRQQPRELSRTLRVASAWSLLFSAGLSLGFALAGEHFIDLQTNLPAVRAIALVHLPYLAALPLIAVTSYVLDGLFVGATRAREMRNAMLIALALYLPLSWPLIELGNHGLWAGFLLFMAMRSLLLLAMAWRITRSPKGFC
ncbi:MATE family efflux transporter [Atopomonas sediminilitoris]|uniref:MATE family efflux transporter n=1 Tax=Atopomonas sediminilitoris TaxID=2919919 RepID=UPI001F4E62AF|nr:MATE family efflux transporter [Atopomonas sediminilitoris]MCJ8170593.1 MATE family efflux transporter [Atopomonas sediminilitoris]